MALGRSSDPGAFTGLSAEWGMLEPAHRQVVVGLEGTVRPQPELLHGYWLRVVTAIAAGVLGRRPSPGTDENLLREAAQPA